MTSWSIVKKLLFCGAKGFPSIADSNDSRVLPVPQARHVRVYVGRDINMMSKFEMKANYLNHPLVRSLLQLSAEQQFGYSYDGALRIACDLDLFRYILHLLDTNNPTAHYMELSDLISKFYSTNDHDTIKQVLLTATKMLSSIVNKLLFCGAKGFPSISDSDDFRLVPVYVGRDIDKMCKFEMEANYLNHPLFHSLLELSTEQEFGYSYDSALRIACDVDLFHYLLHLLETRNPSAHYMELSDLISKFYASDNYN